MDGHIETICPGVRAPYEEEYKCKYCAKIIPGWWKYIEHITDEHPIIKVVVSKTGTRYHYRTQTGRPRTGETKQCLLCGRWIYVRKYRFDKGLSRGFCKKCANELFLPPRWRNGQNRDKAGLVCRNCGAPFFAAGQDLICLQCGNRVHLRENIEGLNLCQKHPHHWDLDQNCFGVCRHCGAAKQFLTPREISALLAKQQHNIHIAPRSKNNG